MHLTKTLALASLVFACFSALPVSTFAADPAPKTKSSPKSAPALGLGAFADSAGHWRHIRDNAQIIKPRPNHPAYAPTQIREIVANIILFQRDNGGWPKNYDMAAILNADEIAAVRATKSHTNDITFDNGTCHAQVAYLARAAALLEKCAIPARPATNDELADTATSDLALIADCRAAAERGIAFILSAQYPNGGFPQGWPNPQGYAQYITFNDGVMIGILGILRDVANSDVSANSINNSSASSYAWISAATREKCRAALDRGVACLLATQYRAKPLDSETAAAKITAAAARTTATPATEPGAFAGKLTGWGQQHNHVTLAPDHARKFELASLSAADTADIADFLMGLENPSPEIITAINDAVAWLDAVAIPGIRLETISAAPTQFSYHNSDKDRRIYYELTAPLIWARMYELDTDRPIFCGRDGIKRYVFAEIDRDRRTGYAWYGYWPTKLLETEYAAWLAKNPAALVTAASNVAPATARRAIPLDALEDGAHHWRYYQGEARPENSVYRPDQVREIVANILFHQLDNGGWAKNRDMCAILTPEQREYFAAQRSRNNVTFDNETVHSHVAYLAKAYELLGDEACKKACLAGMQIMLDAQLASGGFPQSWPPPEKPDSYTFFITFNDRVTVGILSVLRDAADGKNGFSWLDAARREKCRAAVDRGLACILATQYRNADGTLTAWGQQHDPKTLKPAKGRAFELPSLCSQDTAEIAIYLMGYENPTPEVAASIRAAMRWLEKSKLTGIRLEEFKSTPAVFPYHKTDIDRRVVEDPKAPAIWARMYELETNRPQFCGRDTIKRYTFAEVDRDRRTGYEWYGYWPTKVCADIYPAWLKKHGFEK